ncbi:hypothetical protein ABZP36_013159 [Zizania latifolia]
MRIWFMALPSHRWLVPRRWAGGAAQRKETSESARLRLGVEQASGAAGREEVCSPERRGKEAGNAGTAARLEERGRRSTGVREMGGTVASSRFLTICHYSSNCYSKHNTFTLISCYFN